MTNESKTAAAKALVSEEVARLLRYQERRIERMNQAAAENFLRFFEWNAEEMFISQTKVRYYKETLLRVDAYEGNDLAHDLCGLAQRKINDIARGSLTQHSTNVMMNLAYSLRLKAEQELINEIEGWAYLAKEADAL